MRNPFCPMRNYDAWKTWTDCQDPEPEPCERCDDREWVACGTCDTWCVVPVPHVGADLELTGWIDCPECDGGGEVDCPDCEEERTRREFDEWAAEAAAEDAAEARYERDYCGL